MKRYILVLGLLVVTITSACGARATATQTSTKVEDQASLVSALTAAGATVETGDSITQDFFTPEGHILRINGQEVQVFEYQDASVMESEAAKVAPDGGSVGTSMMTWMDAPHFYRIGRLIILYVGSDQTVLNVLNKVIGPQFAGR